MGSYGRGFSVGRADSLERVSAESSEQDAQAAASELEADAASYPGEQGELLLEAAHQWDRAGEPGRAMAVLERVLGLGGQDAGFARFQLAERCFERGDDEQAWAHLRALEQAASDAVQGPAELVAELLEQRGDYETALAWFDCAVSAEDIAAILADAADAGMLKAIPLFGRQRCRAALGYPEDEGDRAAALAEAQRQKWASKLDALAATSHRDPGASGSRRTEMLVWPRRELDRAHQRWPGVFTGDIPAHCAAIEQRLRRMADQQHASRITLITGTVDGLADYLRDEGGDPGEESTRLSYAARARELGHTLPWPPGRNQPCWCGSGQKYKKCCGRPAASTT
jgi:tetratricopeptide (TPR) repeat protein